MEDFGDVIDEEQMSKRERKKEREGWRKEGKGERKRAHNLPRAVVQLGR